MSEDRSTSPPQQPTQSTSSEAQKPIGLEDLESPAGLAFKMGDHARARTLLREDAALDPREATFLREALAWDRLLLATPFALGAVWIYATLAV